MRGQIAIVLNSLKTREFVGFENERKDLKTLLNSTLSRGESNSVLVIGPRGSGKSAMVQSCLEEVGFRPDHSVDALIVKLNGLLDTNDKLALKQITRQLQLENATGDKVFGSFSEHLEFLLNCLKSGENKVSKPIVFILDEFDLFCGHHNQTLLYNLFDTAQSKGSPILIIGLTSKVDVVDSLEKRVLSRFGRRSIHLWEITDFDKYYQMVRHFLIHPKSEKTWCRQVEAFLADEMTRDFFRKTVFAINCSLSFLQLLIAKTLRDTYDEDFNELSLILFENNFTDMTQDLELEPLQGLTLLDLSLVISCMHRMLLHPDLPINFATVFQDYQQYVSRNCSMLNHDRSVMIKCWEKIIHQEIIRPTEKNSKIQNEFRCYALNVLPEEIRKAVNLMKEVTGPLKDWANRTD